MELLEYGSSAAENVLIQPTGEHERAQLENEVREIQKRTAKPFRLLAVPVTDWNRELSPWPAPAVFGREDFGDGAAAFLARILPLCSEKDKQYFLGGYSLAGLFALWATCETDRFTGIAAASPSLWFPGFLAHMQAHPVGCGTVYLSLGDREEKTKNPVMATIGECVRAAEAQLKKQGVNCTLEWNAGSHFKEPDIRTAKAFAWVLEHSAEDK